MKISNQKLLSSSQANRRYNFPSSTDSHSIKKVEYVSQQAVGLFSLILFISLII